MHIMKTFILILLLMQFIVLAEENLATLRSAEITIEPDAPRMGNEENKDLKRKRNYPMQPPTIPHKVSSYRIDLNSNKCLSCHSRRQVPDSQAPMVSVTHYMDRDGNFLAEVSPRRYFCNQCHVPQVDAKPLVENTFQDMNSLMQEKQQQEKAKAHND